MNDGDDKDAKRRTGSLPPSDQAANDEAMEDGLVTDEGVNEDRSGAHGPTLEEGEQGHKAGRPGSQHSDTGEGASN